MAISLIDCLVGTAAGSLLGYLFVRGSDANGFEVAFYTPPYQRYSPSSPGS